MLCGLLPVLPLHFPPVEVVQLGSDDSGASLSCLTLIFPPCKLLPSPVRCPCSSCYGNSFSQTISSVSMSSFAFRCIPGSFKWSGSTNPKPGTQIFTQEANQKHCHTAHPGGGGGLSLVQWVLHCFKYRDPYGPPMHISICLSICAVDLHHWYALHTVHERLIVPLHAFNVS